MAKIPARKVQNTQTSQLSDVQNYVALNNTSSSTVTATTTSGSKTVTSSGAFSADDVGKAIEGTGIPDNAIIVTFTNSSSVKFETPPSVTFPHGESATASGSITATLREGFSGTYTNTRTAGVIRELVVIALTLADGTAFPSDLGGTFVFQYSEDAVTSTITEVRAVTDFSSVRDFDLINAGEYFRVMFSPNRDITSNETIEVITTLRYHFDGGFVRLAGQEIEEANAAMPTTFAYLKAFIQATEKSTNVRANSNGQLFTADTNLEVAQGNVTGQAMVEVAGSNPDIDTGSTPEDVWANGGVYTGHPISTSETVDVRSSSVNDTSAGTGARTVEIYGLDADWTLQNETITLNGTSDVASSGTYRRIFRVEVLTAGSGATNAGIITVEHTTTSANVFATIPAGHGRSQLAVYTIPAAKTGYLVSCSMVVGTNSASNLAVGSLRTRESGSVYHRRIPFQMSLGNLQPSDVIVTLPAKTDVKFHVESVTDNNSRVTATARIILVDD